MAHEAAVAAVAAERKEGTIYSWTGRWGTVKFTYRERYFLHVSEFDAKRLPIIGEAVTFETAPPFPTAGGANKLPRAVNVKPVVNTPVLAGKDNVEGVA